MGPSGVLRTDGRDRTRLVVLEEFDRVVGRVRACPDMITPFVGAASSWKDGTDRIAATIPVIETRLPLAPAKLVDVRGRVPPEYEVHPADTIESDTERLKERPLGKGDPLTGSRRALQRRNRSPSAQPRGGVGQVESLNETLMDRLRKADQHRGVDERSVTSGAGTDAERGRRRARRAHEQRLPSHAGGGSERER